MVDEVLDPGPSFSRVRGCDVKASLDEAVRELREAVAEPQRETENPGVDPLVIERGKSPQAFASSSSLCLGGGNQGRERRHDDHSTPGL